MNTNENHTRQAQSVEVTSLHLGDTLADLVDLTLQGKQAHWNVVGPRFRPLHLQLDQLVEHIRRFSDTVAERMSALGTPARGSAHDVDQRSKLDRFPNGFVRDEDVIKLMVERIDAVTTAIRTRIAPLRDHDPVSEDLLVDILGVLEEQSWMLRAQAA